MPSDRQGAASRGTAVRNLAQHHAAVVLSGLDLASHPEPATLNRTVLGALRDLPRLRPSRPDPATLDGPFWRTFAGEPRLMPHLHPSVQHGHGLRHMRRLHSRTGPLQLVARTRAARPDVAFGAGPIAGFPTGTEGRLCTLLDPMAEAGLTFPHVFACSARAGTPAARMPPSPMARRGCIEHILVEADGRGHTPHFAPIRISGAPRGALLAARVTASDRHTLMAEAA